MKLPDSFRTILNGFKSSGSFIHNVGVISSGKLVVVASSFIFIPILSRIYEPEAYGVFAYYNAFVSIGVLASTLGFPACFTIVKDRFHFYNLFAFSLMTLSVGTILAFGLLLTIGERLGWTEKSYLVPLGLLIGGLISLFSNWNIRTGSFKIAAFLDGSGNILIRLTNLLIGLKFGAPTAGLVFGDITGKLYASIINLSRFWRDELIALKRSVSLTRMVDSIRTYRNYPKYILPNQLIGQVAGQAPILIINYLFGAATLGLFSMSMSLLSIPIQLITNGIATVYLKKAHELYEDSTESLARFTEKLFNHLILILFLPFVIVSVFAVELITFILGRTWQETGVFVSYMGTYFFMQVVIAPAFPVFQVLKLEKKILIFNIVRIVSTGVALVFGYLLFNSPIRSIQLFSAVSLINYLGMAAVVCRVLEIPFWRFIMKNFTFYVVITTTLLLVKRFWI